MMVWIRRRYATETWADTPFFGQFEKHFMGLNAPLAMLMNSMQHGGPGFDDLDTPGRLSQAAAYPGFEEAPAEELPKRAALLIGHDSEFEKLFSYGSEDDRGPLAT